MNLTLKKFDFNVEELEEMLPYEREAYILMIQNELREKKEKREQNKKVDIR